MKNNREPGFYWVKFNGWPEWQIAEWVKGSKDAVYEYFWNSSSLVTNLNTDYSFSEINETRIKNPDEGL